jgi:hypothetical protein
VVIPVVILVVVAASLTADFARWEIGSVNIRVSGLREYRLRESVKVTGCYVLSRNRKHASRCEHARNGTTNEGACLGPGRSVSKICAEEHHDAPGDVFFAKMNMGLRVAAMPSSSIGSIN